MKLGADNFLNGPITSWCVVTLIVLLLAISNLPWQLDDYDQAKQAFTSYEMVNEGQWLYQRTPNEKVATKPPLVGWISAGIFDVTGSWNLAWRLPSLLTALALLALIYRAAARAYGSLSGLLAMSAFGLNMLSLRLATLVRTDMALTLIVFLLGWQIWKKIRTNDPWRMQDRWLSFALLTAAMLIKGPIVYAFLLPGIVVFQWRRRKNPTTVGAWSGWWPWLFSFAVFLLWAIDGIFFAHNFYDQVVVREFVERFGETVHKPQAIYFYLPHLLHKFAPWSLLLIALAILKMTAGQTRLRDWWRRGSPEIVWLVVWSLGGLFIMSLIPSKRVDRIFPVIAPLCLFLGALVGRSLAQEKLRERVMNWSAIALICACLVGAGYTTVKIAIAYHEHRGALVSFGHAVRAEAAAQGWRYEVIGGEQEGLLLYLRKLHFAEPADVIAKWNAGEINAVVAPEADRPLLLRDLGGSIPARLQSWRGNDKHTPHYIVLTKS